MKKRDFLKTSLLGIAALSLPKITLKASSNVPTVNFDYWFWVRPDERESESTLKARYKSWREAGATGVFFEDYHPRHFALAKAAGLLTHRWMWTMNRGEKSLLQSHPEYYAVSRSGKSCAKDPVYVDYYRFLCPSHPDVPRYLEERAHEQLMKEDVDGLHLDYIRYPDVILPVNLWDNYKIKQHSELPDYDFCYSDYSKKAFLEETGIDIDQVANPDQSMSWRYFRYRQINKIVNRIADVAQQYKKPLTAAVFPTPEIAKRIVRQDWTNWNLSAVFPMIYHGFYQEPVSWIGEAVNEGVQALHKKFPLYAGLYLPDFENMNQLRTALTLVKENGGAGISLFGESMIDQEILDTLRHFKYGH